MLGGIVMENKMIELLSKITHSKEEISPNILILNFTISRAFIIGNPKESSDWILIDTGLENSFDFIIKCSEERFGENNPPKAIILTHGHFDHVGSVIKLSEKWKVPVYIHKLELPYVTGKEDYNVGNPDVDSGMVAKISPSFPHTSINIPNVMELPRDGTVPYLSDWEWIHTPGHTKGHISLFDKKNKMLIVGDAFTTLKQESFLSVLFQTQEVNLPPKYFTENPEEVKTSIQKLKELDISLAIPSHGNPIDGKELIEHLERMLK